MLYSAKLITIALLAASIVSVQSTNPNLLMKYKEYDVNPVESYTAYGCAITMPGNPGVVTMGSTMQVNWTVEDGAFDSPTEDKTVRVDLMQGQYTDNNNMEIIASDMDPTVCETSWHVSLDIPAGTNYYLKLYSKDLMECFGPKFSIQAPLYKRDLDQTKSQQGVPMVVPVADGIVRDSSIVRNIISSASHKVDSNLANLTAGLLVFGAFLWA